MPAENDDIDSLRSIVVQEKKFRDTLEEYCSELSAAIAELTEQQESGDAQNNEWKTRCEIQQEVNEQLRKQATVLQDKTSKAARESQDYLKSARANGPPVAFGLATLSMLNALEKEKLALKTQLLNIELRVDQEAKAYHKANEERKAVQLEIGTVNAQLSALKVSTHRTGTDDSISDLTAATGKEQGARIGGGGIATKNIAPNQRVLDPKLGPIKKTAAVKQLPPL